MDFNQILEQILSDGPLRLGDPWRLGEDGMTILVPIRYDGPKIKRAYVLPSEAEKDVKLSDSGGINRVNARNVGKDPVFFRPGTVLKGFGTQPRAVVAGTIIEPEAKEVPVEVCCIQASRGIQMGSSFRPMKSFTPFSVQSALHSRNQHAVWSAVSRHSEYLASVSDSSYGLSDDLTVALEATETTDFGRQVMEALGKVPDYEDQVGVAIINMQGVQGVEAFDHPDSWKALGKEVLKSYEEIFSRAGEVAELFEINLDAAREKVKAFLRPLTLTAWHSLSGTQRVDSGDVAGEYTMHDERCIHLILTRRRDVSSKHPRAIIGGSSIRMRSRGETAIPSTISPAQNTWTDQMGMGQFEPRTWMTWTGKGAEMTLCRLQEMNMGFDDLVKATGLARSTQSSRLKEFVDMGDVEVVDVDGKKTYRITAKGQSRFVAAQG